MGKKEKDDSTEDETIDIHVEAQENEPLPIPALHTKINWKGIVNTNAKSKTTKCLKENVENDILILEEAKSS